MFGSHQVLTDAISQTSTSPPADSPCRDNTLLFWDATGRPVGGGSPTSGEAASNVHTLGEIECAEGMRSAAEAFTAARQVKYHPQVQVLSLKRAYKRCSSCDEMCNINVLVTLDGLIHRFIFLRTDTLQGHQPVFRLRLRPLQP